jgi:uroporphyrinogen decarboxylase
MPQKYEPQLAARLGRDPDQVFHRGSWFGAVSIKYKGLQLFDTDTHRFEQSVEEFEMLRERFSPYLPKALPPGSRISEYGVVSYQPPETEGHLRTLINPLANVERISELDDYPFPDAADEWRWKGITEEIERGHKEDRAVIGGVHTILEDVNFVRGMEQTLIDMAQEDDVGRWLWDRLAADRLYQAKRIARLGVDIIGFGDHLATQRGSFISREMLRKWIIPAYAPIVSEALAIKPDLVFAWHTDGKNDDFIYDELMNIGVTVFNPVEADCEDPHALKERYGSRIVLWGTGAKSFIENATPPEIRAWVADRVQLARRYGGILIGVNCNASACPFENLLEYNLAAEELGARKALSSAGERKEMIG